MDDGEQRSPLQIDLARRLIERLRDEGVQPGEKLSVAELARVFGVSRSPMGRALDILTSAGILRPAEGRGLELARDPSGLDLAQILPESPQEELYRRMMRERATGILPRDVSEAELIPRYGVPRGTVRKLLMRFAAEGLAQRLPGHGWRFAESLESDEAYRESYEFRIVIECAALESPGFRIDPERAELIHRAHERVLAGGGATVDGDEWFRVNAAFHEGLASFSGNRFFVEAVRQQNNLRRMQESAAFAELPADRIRQSCREHLDILAAAQAGDCDWAASLLRRHLRQAADFRWPA